MAREHKAIGGKQPRVRRDAGKRDETAICAVAWLDLLGYGAMLRKARFDPEHPSAALAVARLKAFHKTLGEHAHGRRVFPIMPLNDGAACCRDLSLRDSSVTYDFIARSLDLFSAVNTVDVAKGHPGARMVIAAGIRVRDLRSPLMDPRHAQKLVERLKADPASAEQTVYDAFYAQPIFGFVPDLQANFAFSKAYLAERDGSRAGLAGPKCFLDHALVSPTACGEWLTFNRTISWAQDGIAATFGEVSRFDRRAARTARGAGARTALEVREELAGPAT